MVPNGYKITNSMKTKTGHLAIVPFDEPVASENTTLLRSKALDITCVNIIVCVYINMWYIYIYDILPSQK